MPTICNAFLKTFFKFWDYVPEHVQSNSVIVPNEIYFRISFFHDLKVSFIAIVQFYDIVILYMF